MSASARFSVILIISQLLWCQIKCNRLLNQTNLWIATISDAPSIENGEDLLPIESLKRYEWNGHCVHDMDCAGSTEICMQSICTCPELFEYNTQRECVRCPGLGADCDMCCGHSSLVCLNKVCNCVDEMCQGTQGVFVTASQIALSAALIMGFAALAMVVYRLCTKPRYLTARQRAADQAADRVRAGQTSFLRASLSSIQIRVLSRLRDRPPAYENQSTPRQVVVRPPVESVQPPEDPPPYEGHRDSDTHLPPPYSELILSPGGFVNSGYIDTERNGNDDSEPKTVIENSAK